MVSRSAATVYFPKSITSVWIRGVSIASPPM
jgi:hypothetical protein